jgi:hypothetical protein
VSLRLIDPPRIINSANTSNPKKGLKTAQKVLTLGNFPAKTCSFCIILCLFVALFKAIFNIKYFFALPHPAHIIHLRQFGEYVTLIGLFFSKVFCNFG